MTDVHVATPSVSQRAAMGAGWIIAWRIATRNIGLVSTLILVRLLQPTDFGLVALASGFINSVDALSAIGVQDALVRAPSIDKDMYDTGFTLSILRGLITALLIAGLAWPAAAFFEEPRLALVMMSLSLGTLIGAFENIGIIDFRRHLVFRKEFNMQLWSRVCGSMTTITVAIITHSYWALIAGILVYRTSRLLLSYAMSPYRPRTTLRAWSKIIGFSLWTWGQTILSQLRERSDSMVIGRMLGAGQVGVFSVGYELGSLPATELVEPLGRALFSGFASLHNASERLGGMFAGAVGLGVTIILPAGVGISMVADPMVRFALGEKWLAAVPVVQIMAIGAITTIFTALCSTLLNATGRPNVSLFIDLFSTIVKVTGLILLIPRLGLTGAAIALVFASLVDLALLLRAALPRAGASPMEIISALGRPALATSVMVFVLWGLGMAWTESSGATTLGFAGDVCLRSFVGATCYLIVLTSAWLIAGRPDGAENFSLRMIRSLWGRVRESA